MPVFPWSPRTDPGAAEAAERARRADALRADLLQEYYALLGVVSEYDGRFFLVKGWSVTLSLAALGLGFDTQHFALFALAALSALGFWYLDALLKGHQMRCYSRMRDIEVAAYELNRVELADLGAVSAPRIDMTWGFTGADGPDWRSDRPARRTPAEVRRMLLRRFVLPQVVLPHAVAVVLGSVLFVAALAGGWGLGSLEP